MIKTRDQQYAETIYHQVKQLEQRPPLEQKQYGSVAHKLPILIRSAGLAQALAFVAATGKKRSSHQTLLKHLAQTVSGQSAEQFLETSRNASLGDYIRLTQNSLSALLWYKRFAQSVLGVEAGADTEDGQSAGGGDAQ